MQKIIHCVGCNQTKDGDPTKSSDINTNGWKLIISQDSSSMFNAVCPICKSKIGHLSNEIFKLIPRKYVYLWQLME